MNFMDDASRWISVGMVVFSSVLLFEMSICCTFNVANDKGSLGRSLFCNSTVLRLVHPAISFGRDVRTFSLRFNVCNDLHCPISLGRVDKQFPFAFITASQASENRLAGSDCSLLHAQLISCNSCKLHISGGNVCSWLKDRSKLIKQ